VANQMFDPGREGFLTGQIDWDTAVIKVGLIRNYTFNPAHKFVSELTGTITTSGIGTLANKTFVNGVAGADPTTITAVPTAAGSHYLVIYQASAVGGGADVATSAQRLICYIDDADGLPITPNGNDVTITWSTGVNKIFKL
jgi:hypothetical protein